MRVFYCIIFIFSFNNVSAQKIGYSNIEKYKWGGILVENPIWIAKDEKVESLLFEDLNEYLSLYGEKKNQKILYFDSLIIGTNDKNLKNNYILPVNYNRIVGGSYLSKKSIIKSITIYSKENEDIIRELYKASFIPNIKEIVNNRELNIGKNVCEKIPINNNYFELIAGKYSKSVTLESGEEFFIFDKYKLREEEILNVKAKNWTGFVRAKECVVENIKPSNIFILQTIVDYINNSSLKTYYNKQLDSVLNKIEEQKKQEYEAFVQNEFKKVIESNDLILFNDFLKNHGTVNQNYSELVQEKVEKIYLEHIIQGNPNAVSQFIQNQKNSKHKINIEKLDSVYFYWSRSHKKMIDSQGNYYIENLSNGFYIDTFLVALEKWHSDPTNFNNQRQEIIDFNNAFYSSLKDLAEKHQQLLNTLRAIDKNKIKMFTIAFKKGDLICSDLQKESYIYADKRIERFKLVLLIENMTEFDENLKPIFEKQYKQILEKMNDYSISVRLVELKGTDNNYRFGANIFYNSETAKFNGVDFISNKKDQIYTIHPADFDFYHCPNN